jgi:hypothetical protein
MDPRYKSPGAVVRHFDDSSFRDLGNITAAVQWLLRVGVFLIVVTFVSSWMQLELLSHEYTREEGEANDLRASAIGSAEFLLTIATLIVFGRWIVLAHRNLVPLGANFLEFRPGWAVGWFFVPIANLWKPYQAMKALWQNSHSVVKPDLQDNTWLLPTWWTLWLISSILGNFLMRLTLNADTVEELVTTTQLTLLNCIVDLPLYLFAASLVGRIWKAQEKQRENPEEFQPARGFADGGSQA